MNRIKLDALPVPSATWIVWTKDESDKNALARYLFLFHTPPAWLIEYSNYLWAGPLPEEV